MPLSCDAIKQSGLATYSTVRAHMDNMNNGRPLGLERFEQSVLRHVNKQATLQTSPVYKRAKTQFFLFPCAVGVLSHNQAGEAAAGGVVALFKHGQAPRTCESWASVHDPYATELTSRDTNAPRVFPCIPNIVGRFKV